MSRLAEYRKLEQQLAAQMQELELLKSDSRLQREIEFETELQALLREYGYGLREIVGILNPEARTVDDGSASPTGLGKRKRKARVVKVYKNPHTGERVETKGGNNWTLRAWKTEYGAGEVDSWLDR